MVWPPPGYTHAYPNLGGECGAYHEEFAGIEGHLYPPGMGQPVTVQLTQKSDQLKDLRMIDINASIPNKPAARRNLPHWPLWSHHTGHGFDLTTEL